MACWRTCLTYWGFDGDLRVALGLLAGCFFGVDGGVLTVALVASLLSFCPWLEGLSSRAVFSTFWVVGRLRFIAAANDGLTVNHQGQLQGAIALRLYKRITAGGVAIASRRAAPPQLIYLLAGLLL